MFFFSNRHIGDSGGVGFLISHCGGDGWSFCHIHNGGRYFFEPDKLACLIGRVHTASELPGDLFLSRVARLLHLCKIKISKRRTLGT